MKEKRARSGAELLRGQRQKAGANSGSRHVAKGSSAIKAHNLVLLLLLLKLLMGAS
jgi:hypothetical protein